MNLDKRYQFWIGLALVALLAVTRGHHFATLENLPSASWAVFFLAGFYLRGAWAFTLLLGEAVFLDYAAITFGGVSSFCVTPAYGFLLPAYGVLWLAGRWFAARYRLAWSALLPFSAAFLLGAVASELFSSGGFYFFGGRFAEPTLAEFGARLTQYFPRMLSSFAFWIATATVIHLAFAYSSGLRRGQKA